MTPMTDRVFNTTPHVITTARGGVIGPYETAAVDPADAVVKAGVESGALVVQAEPKPKPAAEPAPSPSITEPED